MGSQQSTLNDRDILITVLRLIPDTETAVRHEIDSNVLDDLDWKISDIRRLAIYRNRTHHKTKQRCLKLGCV